jgi:hypothetical protein
MPFGIGQLTCPVTGDTQGELAFFRAYRCAVDLDIAKGIGRERFLRRLIAFPIWQALDALPPQATMEGGSGQMRPRRLQRRQAGIEREQGRLAKSDQQCCFCGASHGGAGLLRPHRHSLDIRALLPLRHGLWVQVITLGPLG